jgi:hypothetical protein
MMMKTFWMLCAPGEGLGPMVEEHDARPKVETGTIIHCTSGRTKPLSHMKDSIQ